MEKWKYGIPVLLVFAVVGVYMYSAGMPTGISDGLHYTGIACITTVQSGVFHDYGCQHNLITKQGQDQIKWAMQSNATAGTINLDTLGIANSTSPQLATDVDLNGLRVGCDLGIAVSTQGTGTPAVGNWSLAHTWTSACDGAIVNATGIYNTTSTGHLFAEANFTSVTLNNGDQLTVTYYTWVAPS